MATSPLPDLSLIKMHRYSTMAVQYSRGCPSTGEFCDIIEIYGRRPRTKSVAQVLADLINSMRGLAAKRSLLLTDNFIGNKARAKELCKAFGRMAQPIQNQLRLHTEAFTPNLADDPELMQLMKDAGFVSVFLGIETPMNRVSSPATSSRTRAAACWTAWLRSRVMECR